MRASMFFFMKKRASVFVSSGSPVVLLEFFYII
jgi:hypothetical protein